MNFLLDEGVPVSVGRVLRSAKHQVIFFKDSGLAKGSSDPVVCAAAQANNAVLVAADHDMKQIALGKGITSSRFKKLGLVRFECRKPDAASRMADALSLIEHEHSVQLQGRCVRIFIVIGKKTIRTHR